MYIYLSNRKRKSYLSLGLPQNLSGKSLSFKDLRFLNQNIGQKNKERFSANLKSQQKFLYEKHIYKSLISQIFLKKKNLNCNYPYIYISNSFSLLNLAFILQKLGKNPLKTLKSFSSSWTAVSGEKTQGGFDQSQDFTNSLKKEQKTQKPFSILSYNFPSISSLSIYIQKIKISKKKNIYNKSPKFLIKKNESLYIFYKNKIKDLYQKNFKIDFFLNNFLQPKTDFKEILTYSLTPPLFLNGLNQKINSIFLYRIEQFKTCYKPLIVKKDSISSRGKNLLHERKKIALYYGQIGKKDISQICQKAKSLPGLFEDNLYTLLESRVDVLVYRAGFSKTINSARILIRNGFLELNGKNINSCKIYAKPGDFFSLKKKNLDSYKITTISLHNCFQNFEKGGSGLRPKVSNRSNWIDGSRGNPRPTKILKKLKTSFLEKNYNTFFSKKDIKLLKEKSFLKKFTQSGFNGFCTIGFFLYKNIILQQFSQNLNFFLNQRLKSSGSSFNRAVEKKFNTGQLEQIENIYIKIRNFIKKSKKSMFFFPSKKYSLLLNVYCAKILEKKTYQRKNLWKKKKDFFKFFMKNIQNANYASIWGQKPIHLEISQKTTSFIYLYKPQKIISPLCIDLNILRSLK